MIRSQKVLAIIAIFVSAISLGARLGFRKETKHKAMVATLAASVNGINARMMNGANQSPGAPPSMLLGANYESKASSPQYTVDYGSSYLIALTGKSGLFSFAGHNHAVVATRWSANFNLSLRDLDHSDVSIAIPATSLVIDSTEARHEVGLGQGPNEADVQTIQQRMLSSEVLNAKQFPLIKFAGTSMEIAGHDRLRVDGVFTLHGTSRRISVPLRYRVNGQSIVFDGTFNILQTDYRLKPESVAGGTIKVKNDVAIRIHVKLTSK